MRQTVIAVAAATVLGGCCRTRTVAIDPIVISPIHITVDVTAEANKPGERAPGALERLVEAAAERFMAPGTPLGDLMLGCAVFVWSQGRWPDSLDDVAAALWECDQPSEGLWAIETIEFRTTENGDLEVTYRASGPVGACLRLTKPDGSEREGEGSGQASH